MKPVYRFLTDHHINGVTLEAGSVHEMPESWRPTGSVEPTNADAALIFYRAGPQPIPAQPNGLRCSPPKTFWVAETVPGQPHRRWRLTGLGAEFDPVWGA